MGGTTEVGSYPRGASPYGCFDMAGNVFEWTSSEFPDGRAVMKGGGSWDDQPGICRAAARHGRNREARHILFGFRCVCETEAKEEKGMNRKDRSEVSPRLVQGPPPQA